MARESTKKSKSASTAKEFSERVRELLRKFAKLSVPDLQKYAEERGIHTLPRAEHEELCLHIAKWQELQEKDPTNYRLAPAPASSSHRFKTPPPSAGPAIIPTYPDCKENPRDTRRYPMRQYTSKEYENAHVKNGFFKDNGPESTPERNKTHGPEPFAEPQAQALTVQMLQEVFERNDAMAKAIDELNELAESLKRKAAAIKQSMLAQRGARQRMMPFKQEQHIFAPDIVLPPGDLISVAVENDEVEKLAALRRSKEKGKGKAKATDEDEDMNMDEDGDGDRDEDEDEDDFHSNNSDDGFDSDDDDKPPFWPSKAPISRAESGSKSAKPFGSNTTTTRPREDDAVPVAPQAHDAPLPDAPQERPNAAPSAAPQAHDAARPDSPQEMPKSFKKTGLKRNATFLDVRDADNDGETLQPAPPLSGLSDSPQAGPSRPRPAKRARLSPPPSEETTLSGRTLSTRYPDPAGRTSTGLMHSPEDDSLLPSPRRDGRFVDPNDVLPNGIEANMSQRVPRSSRRGGAGARPQRRAPTPFPDAANIEAGPSRPHSTRPSRVRRDGIFALLANQGTATFGQEEEDGHSASDEDALDGPSGIVPRTQAPAPAPAPAPAEGSGVPQERKARRRIRKPEHK